MTTVETRTRAEAQAEAETETRAHAQAQTRANSLDIVRLTETQWRVTDHVDVTEDFQVLCYVDECGAHVELTWMRPQARISRHPDFTEAMRTIRSTCLH